MIVTLLLLFFGLSLLFQCVYFWRNAPKAPRISRAYVEVDLPYEALEVCWVPSATGTHVESGVVGAVSPKVDRPVSGSDGRHAASPVDSH